MIRRFKVISLLVGALWLCAAVHADMVPLSSMDDGYQSSPEVGLATDSAPANYPCESADYDEISDSDASPVEAQPEAIPDEEQTGDMVPIQSGTDGRTVVNLWFCAVFGLGLSRSSPFVKRIGAGVAMDSYCDDGPSQIGSSTVITPSDLGSPLVLCFIQSSCVAEDRLPRYCQGTAAPIVRTSQFTPISRIPRGPPVLS